MMILGFVGSSGTGKSFRAISVAKNNGVDFIIDDGLLINAISGKIIAGKSAKKEPTKLASVRRALFVDKEHTESVILAIAKEEPEKIMILGTSVQMVEKIALMLKLPEISSIIYIEDVATKAEIAEAVKIRREQGKHIIPVPTFEIKKEFSGYFLDTLRTFTGKGKKKVLVSEKTVVRPTFSYLGEFHISEKVLSLIAKEAVSEAECGSVCTRAYVDENDNNGVVMIIDLTVNLKTNILVAAKKAQLYVKTRIEELTSLNVLGVKVNVKAVSEHGN